jgi:inner membrane protein
MQAYIVRVILILCLVFFMFIALALIRGVIIERQGLQSQVESTIAESFAGDQRIVAPFLVVPYTERIETKFVNDKGKTIVNVTEAQHERVILPKSVDANGASTVDVRYKGIYKAMTYQLNAKLDAVFEVPENLGLAAAPSAITVGEAYVVLGVSDVRGILRAPDVRWQGEKRIAENGTRSRLVTEGIHVKLGRPDIKSAASYKLNIELPLNGMRSLAFVPLGQNTMVNLQSSWPHPNFGGRFLPQTKSINEAGFAARWEVSQLATSNGTAFFSTSNDPRASLEAFSVSFIEPVNVYQQVERAAKYGLLFIVLTFAAVFLFESLKRLQIHPIQYGFVGVALALFFLLLLSLSEHIAFAYAYVVAAVCCVALIGYYLAYVLKSWARGLLFAGQLAVLYGVLYGLLLSEDNALVMGSVLLFVLLAIVMVATRHVDWFSLWTSASKPANGPTPDPFAIPKGV